MAEPNKVEVERDPEISERANRIIADEMQDATGADEVELRGARTSQEEPPAGSAPPQSDARNSRLLIAIVGGVALVICALLGVLTGSWVFLALAVLVLLLTLGGVAYLIVGMTTSVDKPSAGAVAALEDEGVPDAEKRLNEKLEAEVGEPDEGTRTGHFKSDEDEDRDVSSADKPASATEEQRESVTPTAEPSEAKPE